MGALKDTPQAFQHSFCPLMSHHISSCNQEEATERVGSEICHGDMINNYITGPEITQPKGINACPRGVTSGITDRKHTACNTPISACKRPLSRLSSYGQTSLAGGQAVPDSIEQLLTSPVLSPGLQSTGCVLLRFIWSIIRCDCFFV